MMTQTADQTDRDRAYAQRLYLEQRLLQERKRAAETVERLDERVEELGPLSDGDLSLFPTHPADEASDAMQRELDSALATGAGETFARIEAALSLLYTDPDRYGLCRECGERIAFERLDLIPWAELCEACESRRETGAGEREPAR
jgi:RNA polymerase-binding transcription factor DksA